MISRRGFNKKYLVILFLIPFIFENYLYSAELEVPKKSSGSILITSERMILKNLQDKIIFEGTVIIRNEDLVIESERAEVFMAKSGSSPSLLPGSDEEKQVSKIIASGNVRIKKGRQHAKAERGVYDREKEIIVLTGHPEVWEDGYQVKGKVITFFMAEERTLVIESEVVIHQGSQGTNIRKP